MATSNVPKNGKSNDIPGISFDLIDNLYIGHFQDATAQIETDTGNYHASLWGGILVYCQLDEKKEVFSMEGLRRATVAGRLREPDSDKQIGVISLAGPLELPSFAPDSPNEITSIPLQLHYSAVSELKPRTHTPAWAAWRVWIAIGRTC